MLNGSLIQLSTENWKAVVDVMIKAAFIRYKHNLKTVKNMTDMPPAQRKRHMQIFKMVDFENGILTGTF